MIKHLIEPYQEDVLWLNGDSPDIQAELENVTTTKWKAILGKKKLLVIDEAQRIANIGIAMKLITDELPHIQIIASGSSSFELADKTAEPLTGRKFEFKLLPLSFVEMTEHNSFLEEKRSLEQRLIFGSYPEIICNQGDEPVLLSSLAGSYLYKDLLLLDSIKKPSLLDKLIRAVALQLGSEVKTSELANLVGADNKTVDRYIDLLEKSFVLFTLPSFSRNLRNEIKKGKKIYFYDLGVRNAVIGNFSSLSSRTDIGGLWENYLILERLKNQCNQPFPPRRYFWRTLEQSEVDYIEESGETLSAFEFKYNPNSKAKVPGAFIKSYPHAHTDIITSKNYDVFLLP
jgi:predicted AAA+ superfamily ATPase